MAVMSKVGVCFSNVVSTLSGAAKVYPKQHSGPSKQRTANARNGMYPTCPLGELPIPARFCASPMQAFGREIGERKVMWGPRMSTPDLNGIGGDAESLEFVYPNYPAGEMKS